MPLITAVDLYKESINYQAVALAVHEAFREDNGGSFKWLKSSGMQNAFQQRLIQTMLDNRLCMFYSKISLNHTYIYYIEKRSRVIGTGGRVGCSLRGSYLIVDIGCLNRVSASLENYNFSTC